MHSLQYSFSEHSSHLFSSGKLSQTETPPVAPEITFAVLIFATSSTMETAPTPPPPVTHVHDHVCARGAHFVHVDSRSSDRQVLYQVWPLKLWCFALMG